MAGRDLTQERHGARSDRAPGVGACAEASGETVDAVGGRPERRAARPVDAEGIFAKVKAIADTGFLVAFRNARDMHHEWARGVAENITEPLLVCEAVMAETAYHLDAARALSFLEEGMVHLAFEMADHLPRLKELARRYQDRKPDLADLCLIRMSELHPRHPVITTDLTDFRIYRRGRREAIPLVHP
jgi:uncharacterized protein